MTMMMIGFEIGSSSFDQQSNHGIMGDDHQEALDSLYSNPCEVSSVVSSLSDQSDSTEEVTSSPPFSSSPASSPPPSSGQHPLNDMSSLLRQLPAKRGLSKHFQGKSQSFTSLSNVRCLEDLAKPENPYNKRMKSSRSYMGLSEQGELRSSSCQPPAAASSSSRLISKKSSRGSCSSLSSRRNGSFINGNMIRPPTHPAPPPRRSTSTTCFSNHTPLLA